jgi:hypothetical protein
MMQDRSQARTRVTDQRRDGDAIRKRRPTGRRLVCWCMCPGILMHPRCLALRLGRPGIQNSNGRITYVV